MTTTTKLAIRQLDPASSRAEFGRFYDIVRAAEREGRPEAPIQSEREAYLEYARPRPDERAEAFAAYDGDEMVGAGSMFTFLLDNTDKVYVEASVAPALRRQGIGSALVSHLLDLAAARGRQIVLAGVRVPIGDHAAHPYVLFAQKQGFSESMTDVERRLPLPVSDAHLDALQAAAAPHHPGYTFKTYVDDIPERYLQAVCDLQNQLVVDAPSGDVDFEPWSLTPEMFHVFQVRLREVGRTVYETIAFDAEDVPVAQTTLCIPSDDRANVFQWGTYVRRDQRGHRLGMAVKVRNLRAVQRAYPERRFVYTGNASTNAPMVSINVELGFQPSEHHIEFVRTTAVSG